MIFVNIVEDFEVGLFDLMCIEFIGKLNVKVSLDWIVI